MRNRVIAAVGLAGLLLGAGATPAIAASKAPSKPTSVTATSAKSSYTVAWKASATHGSKVTSYQIADRYKKTNKKWSKWTYKKTKASARKSKVSAKNGSLHQVKVRAKSSKGYSKFSSTVTVRIGLPGAPGGVSAAKGSGKLTASWSTAASNGASITAYRVYTRYKAGSSYSSWATNVAPASARTLTIKGLSNARSYQVMVKALNKNGLGPASVTRSATVQSVSVSAPGPYAGGENVKVSFAGFPASETTLNVAVCANDGRPLTGPNDCAPLGGASNKLVSPKNGAGSATVTVPKFALGNAAGAPITCGNTRNCAIVVTTITSNFFMAGPVVLNYAKPAMSLSPTGPIQKGKDVTVTYNGFPRTETTLNVAVCANDGRPLTGPGDCAPLGGASNKLVTPVNGGGKATLTVPNGALGNTNGAPITCGNTGNCAVVVTTITSNFFMAGPAVLNYPNPAMTLSAGPYSGGGTATVTFSGFPVSETTLNVAVCANDGRPLTGPGDCAPLGGASNKLVSPTNGGGSTTLTLPDGALGNTNGAPITCGGPNTCAVVVTTITSNFFMAGPVAFTYSV